MLRRLTHCPALAQVRHLSTGSAAVASQARHKLSLKQVASNEQLPVDQFYVPRNSKGSLPVYTDSNNGGTRYVVLVRNIQGNHQVCGKTNYPET